MVKEEINTLPKWQERTALLLGETACARLQQAHVLVVGCGGVGGQLCEMLCRAGLGQLTIIDADVVSPSNINRQICALQTNVGSLKTAAMQKRLLQINPALKLTVHSTYVTPEAVPQILSAERYDFVADAIDTIAPKCALIAGCVERDIPLISSMGAGTKSDITQVRYGNLWQTFHCPLSKVVRTRLKKVLPFRAKIPVVFSSEPPRREAVCSVEGENNKRSTCGTISYMPSIFGHYMAAYIIQHIIKQA